MTVDMLKYSQIMWTYFILDVAALVAAVKYVEANTKSHSYEVQEEGSEVRPQFSRLNTTNFHRQTVPTQLGLFVAQPSELKPLSYGPDPNSGAEARYGRNFGFVTLTKKPRGTSPDHLSLFTKVDKKKFKDLFDQRRSVDANYKPLASDQFLAPEFVKFKNEIERETDKTHVRGVKMSKDTNYSPTIVYERPSYKKQNRYSSSYRRNPITQADESYKKPMYQDPGNYDHGTYYSSSTYPGSASYSSSSTSPSSSSYSSSPGSYSSPSHPSYNSYNSYSTSPYSSYAPGSSEPSSYDSDSFPPYPSLPTVDSNPLQYPHSEHEARGQGYGSFKDFPSYRGDYQDYKDDGVPSYPINDGKSSSYSNTEDDGQENDYPPPPAPHSDIFQKAKKYFRNGEYRPPTTNVEDDDDEDAIPQREEKRPFRGGRRKGSRIGRPYGKPSHVSVPVSRAENEDEDFDTNYEPPENPFIGDDNADEEEEEESEEEPPSSPAPPKERLRQPSHEHHKRLQPAGTRKRCVKKKKEMALEDSEDEPGRHMACLLCENLDTGGTYETCNYESEPNKKTFFSSNDVSYREKSPKLFHKYRQRRDVTTVVENLKPVVEDLNAVKRVTRKAADDEGGDPEDFESDSFYDEEQEDDDMTEFKPQPPAYANEDSCVEVKKKNAVCMVCENPGSNGKYEQCSYANDPEKDGYEYAQSSQFGSASLIEIPSKSSKKQKSKERHRRKVEKKLHPDPLGNGTASVKSENTTRTQEVHQTELDSQLAKMPDEWQELRDVEQQKIESVNKMFHALVRTKKEQPNSRFLTDLEDSSYEKQFLDMFPELESRSINGPKKSILSELGRTSIFDKDEMPGFKNKKKLGGYFDSKSILDSGEEGEMSKMMQEFASKDRSACQKRMKDKMTCYICNDEDGIKREECMYVVEKEPKKVKYQESKHIKADPEGRPSKREISKKLKHFREMKPISSNTDDSLENETQHKRATSVEKKPNRYSNVEIHTKKMYSTEGKPTTTVFKRLATFGDAKDLSKQEIDSQPGSSSKRETYNNKKKKKGKADKNDDEEHGDEEEITFDPEETGEFQEEEVTLEVDPASPNGAFSDETETTYDKELKTSLPKFMVEKNEHESVIDDFMSQI